MQCALFIRMTCLLPYSSEELLIRMRTGSLIDLYLLSKWLSCTSRPGRLFELEHLREDFSDRITVLLRSEGRMDVFQSIDAVDLRLRHESRPCKITHLPRKITSLRYCIGRI